MKAWTDYPLLELGDKPWLKAPIREVVVLDYDGNKYCTVEVEGVREVIKCGYLYTKPGRLTEVPAIDVAQLPRSSRG